MSDRLLHDEPAIETDAAPAVVADPGPELPPTTNHKAEVPAPVIENADPYDTASLALGNDDTAQAAKRELTTVPVQRPHRDAFIRVHPDPAYRLETKVIELDGNLFLVARPLWPQLEDETQTRCLFLYVTTSGAVGLWPARLSTENIWNESALQGAKLAMEKWVRIKSNREAGCYDVFSAAGDLSEPEWPDKTLAEILRLAFGDRLIDSMEHHAVRRLMGLSK